MIAQDNQNIARQLESVSVGELSYAFDRHGMSANESAEVYRFLGAFNQRYPEFFRKPEYYQEVVGLFTVRCSVAGASTHAIETITLLVALILYFNDRVGEVDFEAEVDAFLLGVWQGAPSPFARSAGPVSEFQQCVAPLIQRDWANAASFLRALEASFCAGRWESQHLATLSRELDDYCLLRHQTIAVEVYLQLWKLVVHFPAALRAPFGEDLRRLDLLSTRVQYLANDLGSIFRDNRRGQRNSVLLVAERDGIPLVDAWKEVRAWHNEAATSLARSLERVRGASAAPELQWYCAEIEACTWGNLDAVQELSARYHSLK